MLGFTLRRLGASILLLLVVLTATFFLIHLAPGEPSRLFANERITPEQREDLRRLYGLDKPLAQQYLTWMGAVLQGDWGTSISLNRPALEVLLEKMPNTCLLAFAAILVEHGIGLLLGLWAAARANTWVDQQIRWVSLVVFAIPNFWLALLAIEILAVEWRLFPISQMRSEGAHLLPPMTRFFDVLHHLALPAIILGLARSGAVARFVRNGLLETLGQDYIRTAHAKGLSPARVLWVHALPNCLLPVIQRFGLALPILLSGSLVIEVIFAWPGVGLTSFQAIGQRDYPVILASTALTGALVVAGSFVADLLHAMLDPRVRDGV